MTSCVVQVFFVRSDNGLDVNADVTPNAPM